MGKKLNGPLLKALRHLADQRQEDLAEIAGISVRSVREAEHGKSMGIDVCTSLAKALLVDPADQLYAERKLSLSEVRRLDENGKVIEPLTKRSSGSKFASNMTRVRLSRTDRRAMRYYVLSLVTPSCSIKLTQGGINCHAGQIELWNQAVYEGFLSACLFYLNNNTFTYSKNNYEYGNYYTSLKTLMMGNHARKLLGTGEPDNSDYPRNVTLETNRDELWTESEMGPGGDLADDLHRYCQACEPGAFYRGWLECCYWLSGNAALNLEYERPKAVEHYRELVVDLFKSYIDEFEKKTAPGTNVFWALAFFYLQRLIDGSVEEPDGVDFASSHDFTFDELLDHCGSCLEMNPDSEEAIKEVILSYPDIETGYQVALLKLQTEFIYTGKSVSKLITMSAARHPE